MEPRAGFELEVEKPHLMRARKGAGRTSFTLALARAARARLPTLRESAAV